MSNYIGDFAEDATVYAYFTTSDGAGAAVAPSTAFEAADVVVYKDGSATQKTTTNGLTMTSPFDSVTGLHLLAIDTSNDTGDSGFWVAGADYAVVLSPSDETVDGQVVVAVIARFSIENRNVKATLSAAERNAVADALIARNVAGGSSSGRIVKDVLALLRNKWTVAAGTLTVYDVDDSTPLYTATVGGTSGADPVTSIDPA